MITLIRTDAPVKSIYRILLHHTDRISCLIALFTSMSYTIVDTEDQIRQLITDMEECPIQPCFLYVDLEGTQLCRHGTVSIMQILIAPDSKVRLVDVYTLQAKIFETAAASGTTLKDILQSQRYPKAFYDVRRDSDALYNLYGVKLNCVVDIQVLEFATRTSQGRFLSGLGKSIERDAGLGYAASAKCQRIKEAGLRLFAPEKGGSYEVFSQRPMLPEIEQYCAQDVVMLPRLLLNYAGRLIVRKACGINQETIRRINCALDPFFNPQGQHMAMGSHIGYANFELDDLSIVC